MHFCKEQEGNKGEGRWDLLKNEFLVCLQSKSFLDASFFSVLNKYCCCNLQFQKKNLGRINYMEESNLWFECKFGKFSWFGSFCWREDTWLTPKTCCGHVTEQILQKKDRQNNSVPGILGHVPVPRTCLGHVEDISN